MEECLSNNTLFMSKICLNSSINKQSDCFPNNYTDKDGIDFATMAGILCILNAIIGTLGNLLTILALPFAARRKKYDSKIIKYIGYFTFCSNF